MVHRETIEKMTQYKAAEYIQAVCGFAVTRDNIRSVAMEYRHLDWFLPRGGPGAYSKHKPEKPEPVLLEPPVLEPVPVAQAIEPDPVQGDLPISDWDCQRRVEILATMFGYTLAQLGEHIPLPLVMLRDSSPIKAVEAAFEEWQRS
jgi:hypothetical protein